MTEEIIIDGVNIAGCLSFCQNNGHNICCYDDTREDKIPFANFCVENKDCYYKQLKRLKQENEELKERFEKRGELMCNCAKQRENYHSALEEIRIMATKDVSIESFVKIQNKINEVLG